MASYNKVILMGNLTRDPQMSYLPSQTPVVEFGLAVNRRWKGQDNQMKEEVCFVDCRALGKPAETINHYFQKGKPILVEGRLQFDMWEGKDGTKRSKHRVVVERFAFVGPAGPGQGPRPAAAPPAQGAPPPQPPPVEEAPEPPADVPPPPMDESAGGDDIPF
ncbi:MAG: single-stranded DNA-binding protein [Phycisphaerae bacterium]